jgi:hypothetical protein
MPCPHGLPGAAQILEQDLPSTVPVVLCVSDIRTSGGSKAVLPQQQEQQQEQQQQQESAQPAAAAVDVLGIQLTDGWYAVNCCIDAPIVELVQSGKLQVCGGSRASGLREQLACSDTLAGTDELGAMP